MKKPSRDFPWRKLLRQCLVCLIIAAMIIPALPPAAEGADFAGGDGSEDNPFEITTAAHLDNVRYYINDHYFFIMKNPLDLPAWQPIADFSGSFNGNNMTIHGLPVCLFANVLPGAEIKDLTLTGITVQTAITVEGIDVTVGLAGLNDGSISNCNASGHVSGVMAGSLLTVGLVGYNNGDINNCHVSGEVTGSKSTGGLAGYNNGDIVNCSFSGEVSGNQTTGGLVSLNDGSISNCNASGVVTGSQATDILDTTGGLTGCNKGDIVNCSFSGEVSGYQNVGGLVGRQEIHGSITDSFVIAGNITGTKCIGGLAGLNWGTIASSRTTVNVTGERMVGGLVGDNQEFQSPGDTVISNCYAAGNVTGTGNIEDLIVGLTINDENIPLSVGVGGIVGQNSGTITSCYAVGDVEGVAYVGGLVGNNLSEILNSYATGDTTGIYSVGGLVGINLSISGYFGDFTAAVDKCFAAGKVEGEVFAGGLIGYYYIEPDDPDTPQPELEYLMQQMRYLFEVLGVPQGIIDVFLSFWGIQKYNGAVHNCIFNADFNAAASDYEELGIPETIAAMKQQGTFTADPINPWDFNTTWALDEGKTYPYLRWQNDHIDLAPPTFAAGYPQFTCVTADSLVLLVQADESATACYAVLPAGAAAPGAAQVREAKNELLLAAATEERATITDLNPGMEYKIYVTAEDSAGNPQPDVLMAVVAVTTLSEGGGGDNGGYGNDDDYASAPTPAPATGTSKEINAADGGTISLGDVSVIIPPGALPGDATFSVKKLTLNETKQSVPQGLRLKLAGDIYEISTTGSREFGENSITIKIPYNPSRIAPGEKPVVNYYDEEKGEWVALETTLEQGADGRWYAVVEVNHLTRFAVFSTALPRPVKPLKVIKLSVGAVEASVDGQLYTLEAAPFIKPGVSRTLVPLRFIGEALGARVEWLPATRQVVIKDVYTEIILTLDSDQALLNNEPLALDCPAELVTPPDRTFVPLRFVSEALGAQVDYNSAMQEITIKR